MSLIDDIKRDMEAGTPGPWRQLDFYPRDVYAAGRFICTTGSGSSLSHINRENLANARRIARHPDMEAALIAAEELAACLGHLLALDESAGTRSTVHDIAHSTLAAYRKATGGEG